MRQRFIQSFSTSGTEQTAIENKELGKPYVAYIEDGQYIDWNTKEPLPTDKLIVTYNVTSTTSDTKIVNTIMSSAFSAKLEDGTEVPLQNNFTYFRFPNTGPQKVIFTANNYTRGRLPSFMSCITISDVFIPDVPEYTYIDLSGFEKCVGLTKINIPDNITAITNGVNFLYCTGLTEVVIGTNFKAFGNQVFLGCQNLTAVTINTVVPPTIGNGVIDNTNAYFYVPDESVSAYKTAQNWAQYADHIKGISEDADGVLDRQAG